MGKLFYIIGPSASGKDKLYASLLADASYGLKPLVLYTTRPIRAKEENGKQYYFVSDQDYRSMKAEGRVIEERTYETVAGPWTYFTAEDCIDLSAGNYLGIGTLVSYQKLRDHYGADRLVPIYIESSGETRLLRAIRREMKQEQPNLAEVCRRYLADVEDFSEEKILAAQIGRRFCNDEEFADCLDEVGQYIRNLL